MDSGEPDDGDMNFVKETTDVESNKENMGIKCLNTTHAQLKIPESETPPVDEMFHTVDELVNLQHGSDNDKPDSIESETDHQDLQPDILHSPQLGSIQHTENVQSEDEKTTDHLVSLPSEVKKTKMSKKDNTGHTQDPNTLPYISSDKKNEISEDEDRVKNGEGSHIMVKKRPVQQEDANKDVKCVDKSVKNHTDNETKEKSCQGKIKVMDQKNKDVCSPRIKSKHCILKNGRPSVCSPEYAIDTMTIEEYKDTSRLLQETNARLTADVELAKQTTKKLLQACNRRLKEAHERIEDLERELQITFDTALHFETLYESIKMEEGTKRLTNRDPARSTSIPQPREIDVKYLSLLEENKYIKEEMRKLKEENKILKARTQESLSDVHQQKKQLTVCYNDREILQKKLHKQQQQNKLLNKSMTKQVSQWIQGKQQERKLERERQFQRTISPVPLTGSQARWKSAVVKNNKDKPRKIPVERWASENLLKSI